MKKPFSLVPVQEHSACGVGFVASLSGDRSRETLNKGLVALESVEHRGACGSDGITGDGSGIMTEIPNELFGFEKGRYAVGNLFLRKDSSVRRRALRILEEVFSFFEVPVVDYRAVPVNSEVLGPNARSIEPFCLQAFFERPVHCPTDKALDRLLYQAQRRVLTKLRQNGLESALFFCSLSTKAIVYKGLLAAGALREYYGDLQSPVYRTSFALFHRRFSTNTISTWDKAQPFRLIAHNGEINTISGNRSWAQAREQSLGLPRGELLAWAGISDSGSLNEVVESLKHRSSIPSVDDILAIMVPPAQCDHPYYSFWSRAMEPWDGPAFLAYCDGETIGARLDRSGFRPCRWMLTDRYFMLSSEAGSFQVPVEQVVRKGALHAGCGVSVNLRTGRVAFEDPSEWPEYRDASFENGLIKLEKLRQAKSGDVAPNMLHSSQLAEASAQVDKQSLLAKQQLFAYTKEDVVTILKPMAENGKEAIGSMGDTACLAIFSDQPRPLFDYFYHDFAQVTNPPLDYLRESFVTDLKQYIGNKPNIFEPKELIPPAPAIELQSPILTPGDLDLLREPNVQTLCPFGPCCEIEMVFEAEFGVVGFRRALSVAAERAVRAFESGSKVIILSDRNASLARPPIPSLLMLRAVSQALKIKGLRLGGSVIVETGEVRSTHQLAALIGFGATAVCPYLAFEIGDDICPDGTENLLKAFKQGLLKIMSKMGISVVRSYQGSCLFSAVGLGPELIREFFPSLHSVIGGIEVRHIVENILSIVRTVDVSESSKLLNTFQFKEHAREREGERHGMTAQRSKQIHRAVRAENLSEGQQHYEEYLQAFRDLGVVSVRDLYRFRRGAEVSGEIESIESIMTRFGSGAMSFGSLNARAQRDILVAMRAVGGRSNSGEGGENPHYFTESVSATIKQVASGRFGVTAEYLASGSEFQIKIAQGAKPGEGGQLMGIKVTPEIARARHAKPGYDLISPPPLHDIYSIEDLKELIYELKQFKPGVSVSVKLVAGANIGTIAVGVAKAGADIIHISGHQGGTGAAPLSSMKHAGLPWEFGLVEVHQALVSNGLRDFVELRTDGGLQTGRDIVVAALLGAEGFDFGKMMLIAQGCIMARICQNNTCPTGLATHDPKFVNKYKGSPDDIIRMLQFIAREVQDHLRYLGVRSVDELIGRSDFLEVNPAAIELIRLRNLEPEALIESLPWERKINRSLVSLDTTSMNSRILREAAPALLGERSVSIDLAIQSTDRAVTASLSGEIGRMASHERKQFLATLPEPVDTFEMDFCSHKPIHLNLSGSAGQGLGVFLTKDVHIHLSGDANDSVGKSMCGGSIVLVPPLGSRFEPVDQVILGNCALYGATGGKLFAYGRAGDRFAVRNSGAVAVVEGAGLHACEYMTGGVVVVLGSVSHNVGAGMTGGDLFLLRKYAQFVNQEYLQAADAADLEVLQSLLVEYYERTNSHTAKAFLDNWTFTSKAWVHFVPVANQGKSEVLARGAA